MWWFFFMYKWKIFFRFKWKISFVAFGLVEIIESIHRNIAEMFYVILPAFDFTSQTEFQCMKVLWEETNTASTLRWKSTKATVLPNETCITELMCTNASSQFHTKNSEKQNEEKREVVCVFVYTVHRYYVSALFSHVC